MRERTFHACCATLDDAIHSTKSDDYSVQSRPPVHVTVVLSGPVTASHYNGADVCVALIDTAYICTGWGTADVRGLTCISHTHISQIGYVKHGAACHSHSFSFFSHTRTCLSYLSHTPNRALRNIADNHELHEVMHHTESEHLHSCESK